MRTVRLKAAFCSLRAMLLLGIACPPLTAQAPFQNGDVFAGGTDGKIRRFNAAGILVQTIDSGYSGPVTGMCFDAQGNLYATRFSDRSMVKFDRRGKMLVRNWGGPFNLVESCLVDSKGDIYTGEVQGSGSRIRKFDAQGKRLGTFRPKIEEKGVDWIDLAADQCTLFYTSESSSIMRYDVCRGRQLEDFAQGLKGPCYALRLRENGEVLAACFHQAYRLSPQGKVLKSYPIGGEVQFAMNIDPDGRSFWTGGLYSGSIYKVEIAGGSGRGSPRMRARAGRTGQSGGNLMRRLEDLLGDLSSQGGTRLLSGLAVFGERTVAMPAPTPRPAAVDPHEDAPSRAEADSTPPPSPPPAVRKPAPDVPPPRDLLRLAPAEPVQLGTVPSRSEASGQLDLSSSQVEGTPQLRVSTTLEASGVDVELRTPQGWTRLGSRPVALTLDGASPRRWPVRIVVGRCPSAVGPSDNPRLVLETSGGRQEVPLSVVVVPDPWLECWWPLLAVLGGLVLAGVLVHGFVSPSRFAPRLGVVLSPEEDMEEGFFHPIRAQRGSGSGFYRDARIYIRTDYRLAAKPSGALARLRAGGSQVRIQPVGGASVLRQTADEDWEHLPPSESPARFGVVYRDELGTIFFELRTG